MQGDGVSDEDTGGEEEAAWRESERTWKTVLNKLRRRADEKQDPEQPANATLGEIADMPGSVLTHPPTHSSTTPPRTPPPA